MALRALFFLFPLICLTTLPSQRFVSIPAPDGGSIAADEYGAGDRGVVLAHGGRFDKSSWANQAHALAGDGFRVLAIDFRAAVQARAGQEPPCLYDEKCLAVDVLAAVRYLRRTGARTIYVVGASLGGGAAAQASVDANAGEIDRIVLLAHMPIPEPERMKGRKLFIVSRGDLGSGDRPRLPGIREQYEKAPAPKELVLLDGAAHAQFIFDTPEGERLMREMLRFFAAGPPAPLDWERADAEIPRLSPSVFSDVPIAIRRELGRRGCRIPQSFATKTPHNVIRGRFTAANRQDVAALCSKSGSSSILVFRGGSTADVAELAKEEDRGRLQTIDGDGNIGYSRAIDVADPKYIRDRQARYSGPPVPPSLDHDGINDLFVEKASVVWYWYGRRWWQLQGADLPLALAARPQRRAPALDFR